MGEVRSTCHSRGTVPFPHTDAGDRFGWGNCNPLRALISKRIFTVAPNKRRPRARAARPRSGLPCNKAVPTTLLPSACFLVDRGLS